jgi:hypothetical protein
VINFKKVVSMVVMLSLMLGACGKSPVRRGWDDAIQINDENGTGVDHKKIANAKLGDTGDEGGGIKIGGVVVGALGSFVLPVVVMILRSKSKSFLSVTEAVGGECAFYVGSVATWASFITGMYVGERAIRAGRGYGSAFWEGFLWGTLAAGTAGAVTRVLFVPAAEWLFLHSRLRGWYENCQSERSVDRVAAFADMDVKKTAAAKKKAEEGVKKAKAEYKKVVEEAADDVVRKEEAALYDADVEKQYIDEIKVNADAEIDAATEKRKKDIDAATEKRKKDIAKKAKAEKASVDYVNAEKAAATAEATRLKAAADTEATELKAFVDAAAADDKE